MIPPRRCTIPNRSAASETPIVFNRGNRQRPAGFPAGLSFGKGRLPVIVTWIGTAAAIASTVNLTPQAWKIIRTGETKDISAEMYVVTVTAFALWTIYGAILRQWALVASNVIWFGLSGFILFMKLLPRPQKQRVRRSIEKSLS